MSQFGGWVEGQVREAVDSVHKKGRDRKTDEAERKAEAALLRCLTDPGEPEVEREVPKGKFRDPSELVGRI